MSLLSTRSELLRLEISIEKARDTSGPDENDFFEKFSMKTN